MSIPRSVPTMENVPSANAISAAAASSASAAASLPLSITKSAVTKIAWPWNRDCAIRLHPADRDGIRVALAHTDLLAVDAEALRRKLDVHRIVSLSGRLRADIHIDKAIVGEADFRPFGGIAHGDFQIICEANATPFAAPRSLRTSGGEAGVIHPRECRIEHGGRVAGIVGLANGRGMRHRRLRNHVAPAQFRPVYVEFARRGIDQTLQQVIAFGATSASVGIHGIVWVNTPSTVGVDLLEAVDAGQHGAAGERQEMSGANVER